MGWIALDPGAHLREFVVNGACWLTDPRADPAGAPPERGNEDGMFSADWRGRRFGGDVLGLTRRLGYLQDLGVSGLHLCPVFQAGSYHGHDTIDGRHIQP